MTAALIIPIALGGVAGLSLAKASVTRDGPAVLASLLLGFIAFGVTHARLEPMPTHPQEASK